MRAKQTLDSINFKALPDSNKGFYFYYHGLIDGSVSTFYKSVKWFQISRDLFHVQLPLKELLKLVKIKRR